MTSALDIILEIWNVVLKVDQRQSKMESVMNQIKVFFACVIAMLLAPGESGCAASYNPDEQHCADAWTDAGLPDAVSMVPADAGTDAALPSSDGSADPGTPVDAVTTAPTLCSDRATHTLPTGLFRPGFSVWQLCYTTQSSHQADAGVMLGRPATVTFLRHDANTGEDVELIRYPAPAHADPWTASVAISLPDPPGSYPIFNVRNDFADGQVHLAVDRNADGSALTTVGNLRIWRVYGDGHKASYVPRVIANRCTDLMTPDPTLTGSFFPTGSLCPDSLLVCPASQYSCFGVY